MTGDLAVLWPTVLMASSAGSLTVVVADFGLTTVTGDLERIDAEFRHGAGGPFPRGGLPVHGRGSQVVPGTVPPAQALAGMRRAVCERVCEIEMLLLSHSAMAGSLLCHCRSWRTAHPVIVSHIAGFESIVAPPCAVMTAAAA